MIKFVDPTDELITILGDNMRQSDIDEVMASSNHSPHEALYACNLRSDYSVMLCYEDTPLIFCGLTVQTIVTDYGSPWLLSSNEVLKHKRLFLNAATEIIDEMLAITPYLENHVYVENEQSIHWLRYLGFTIASPEPYGVNNKLFHRFYIDERKRKKS